MSTVKPIYEIKPLLENGIKVKKKVLKLLDQEYSLFREKINDLLLK